MSDQRRANNASRASAAARLRARELDSSSQHSEPVADGQASEMFLQKEYHETPTPQPRQCRRRKSKSRKRSQESTGVAAEKENEAARRSAKMCRELQGSQLRQGSQQSKGGVAFETQMTMANEEPPPVITNMVAGAKRARKQAPRCQPAVNRWAPPVDVCHVDKQGASDSHGMPDGKGRRSSLGAAGETRNGSSSPESGLSDQLDAGQSLFHQHSVAVEDTVELLKSPYHKEINHTMPDHRERSMLISDKIVNRVTDRILAKIMNKRD